MQRVGLWRFAPTYQKQLEHGYDLKKAWTDAIQGMAVRV